MPAKETPELDEFLDHLAQLFAKDTVEAIARETKFVQRESKLTGHIFLITYTFAMSIYANPTLEQLTALFANVLDQFGEKLSRVSLHQRINESAVQFFEAMLAQAIMINLPSAQTLKILKQFVEVILLDSTSFQVPTNLVHLFKGAGGSGSEAAMKIRFGDALKSGRFFYKIQEGNASDNQNGNGVVEEVSAGSIRISDLGFFNLHTFAELDEKGAYFLSRWKTGVNLYQRTEEGDYMQLNLVRLVKEMQPAQTVLEVYLQDNKVYHKIRLVIEHVPAKVVRQRIRRKKRECQRKKRSFSPMFKVLASVNMYITNAPKMKLPSQFCRVFYAIRWQIELIFKLWKSNFALARVAGIRRERVLWSLYAKLLCIFLTSKLVFWARNEVWNTRLQELSEFRASKVLQTFLPDVPHMLVFAPWRVTTLLRNAVDEMMRQCIKSTQTTRRYPLEMLEEAFS